MEEESDTRKINNSFLRDQNYATEGIWTYDGRNEWNVEDRNMNNLNKNYTDLRSYISQCDSAKFLKMIYIIFNLI